MTTVIKMSESDLLVGVLDIFARFGWRTLHVRPGRTATSWRSPIQGTGVGFPDVLAVRGHRTARPRIVAAELKVGANRITDAQADWLRDLAAAGVDCYIWRESDYPDRILEVVGGEMLGKGERLVGDADKTR